MHFKTNASTVFKVEGFLDRPKFFSDRAVALNETRKNGIFINGNPFCCYLIEYPPNSLRYTDYDFDVYDYRNKAVGHAINLKGITEWVSFSGNK